LAFKEIRIMDIWEVIRRLQAGHSLRSITRSLGYDRKTIRKYLNELRSKGISLEKGSELDEQRIIPILREIVQANERPSDKQALLEPYRDELIDLVTSEGLKPKSAFNVLCEHHDLRGQLSYTSFKRFVRTNELALKLKGVSCRIEVEPGTQLQVDYGKVGRLLDPRTNTVRTLYAFIATLSYSRHKYVEFTFSQNQQSFTHSHVLAFNFFGGVPTTVVLDNLKSGVISPSLYDPTFNRIYGEMAKHYKCFLDPARVGRPKDKGKVESDVKTVREKFKELHVLYPNASLAELNEKILHWLQDGYGRRAHGTTGWKPYPVFLEEERPALLPLPHEPFEIAFWKEATVHPDCYIQVMKKSYSVPYAYIGKKLWVKVTRHTVQVYLNEQLIKQHTIPLKGNRQTDRTDFPENLQVALDRGLPKYLQKEAAKIGPHFARLVRGVLTPHAYMNLRRAQGVMSAAKAFTPELVERAARDLSPQSIFSPKHFKAFLEKSRCIEESDKPPPAMSQETRSYLRTINYFNHQSPEGEPHVPQSSTTTDAIESLEALRHSRHP
jgi:transposase